jgi:hypothetical protein
MGKLPLRYGNYGRASQRADNHALRRAGRAERSL